MFIEPGIQVNPVEDQAPTQTDAWHVQLHQQRNPDAKVHSRLFLRQTAHGRQRQIGFIHHRSRLGMPCLPR